MEVAVRTTFSMATPMDICESLDDVVADEEDIEETEEPYVSFFLNTTNV